MPSLRESILKISISLLFHVRGNGSFSGLNFHIQDVEIEPPVLKEIPPLYRGNQIQKYVRSGQVGEGGLRIFVAIFYIALFIKPYLDPVHL